MNVSMPRIQVMCQGLGFIVCSRNRGSGILTHGQRATGILTLWIEFPTSCRASRVRMVLVFCFFPKIYNPDLAHLQGMCCALNLSVFWGRRYPSRIFSSCLVQRLSRQPGTILTMFCYEIGCVSLFRLAFYSWDIIPQYNHCVHYKPNVRKKLTQGKLISKKRAATFALTK